MQIKNLLGGALPRWLGLGERKVGQLILHFAANISPPGLRLPADPRHPSRSRLPIASISEQAAGGALKTDKPCVLGQASWRQNVCNCSYFAGMWWPLRSFAPGRLARLLWCFLGGLRGLRVYAIVAIAFSEDVFIGASIPRSWLIKAPAWPLLSWLAVRSASGRPERRGITLPPKKYPQPLSPTSWPRRP